MQNEEILASLDSRFELNQQSKVLIVGLGLTGDSVARFLNKLDIRFAIVDSRSKPPKLSEFCQEFPEIPVFVSGFHDKAFNVATHLIVSPGVSLTEPAIFNALSRGVKNVSEIDLFACAVNEPVIAITGSNGKSTVTCMVGEMVKQAGKKVGVGGNLGVPALDLIKPENELYVLELSSFQLERMTVLDSASAVVLNISPDHLDRHRNMQEYAEHKQAIYRGTGTMVLNLDDPLVTGMRRHYPNRRILTFSMKQPADFYCAIQDGERYLKYQDQKLMPVAELPLEGTHNISNALAALALGFAVGLPFQVMCEALKKFRGLSHRMQKVATIKQVSWINDSKATNIGACVAALEGYDQPLILIAGGDAKGADMRELVPAIKTKVKAVVLIGKDACLIEAAISGVVSVHHAKNIQEAVKVASELAQPGDNVLLSPACASLDQFRDYKDRGDQFSKAVRELAL